MKDLEKALGKLMEEVSKLGGENYSLGAEAEEEGIDRQILEINQLLKGE